MLGNRLAGQRKKWHNIRKEQSAFGDGPAESLGRKCVSAKCTGDVCFHFANRGWMTYSSENAGWVSYRDRTRRLVGRLEVAKGLAKKSYGDFFTFVKENPGEVWKIGQEDARCSTGEKG